MLGRFKRSEEKIQSRIWWSKKIYSTNISMQMWSTKVINLSNKNSIAQSIKEEKTLLFFEKMNDRLGIWQNMINLICLYLGSCESIFWIKFDKK